MVLLLRLSKTKSTKVNEIYQNIEVLVPNAPLRLSQALFSLNMFCKRAYLKNGQTLDPKKFYAIPFQKLVFLISLYPEFLEKNQINKKS